MSSTTSAMRAVLREASRWEPLAADVSGGVGVDVGYRSRLGMDVPTDGRAQGASGDYPLSGTATRSISGETLNDPSLVEKCLDILIEEDVCDIIVIYGHGDAVPYRKSSWKFSAIFGRSIGSADSSRHLRGRRMPPQLRPWLYCLAGPTRGRHCGVLMALGEAFREICCRQRYRKRRYHSVGNFERSRSEETVGGGGYSGRCRNTGKVRRGSGSGGSSVRPTRGDEACLTGYPSEVEIGGVMLRSNRKMQLLRMKPSANRDASISLMRRLKASLWRR